MFLDVFRATAPLLVLYDHMVGLWVMLHHDTPVHVPVVDDWVRGPLRLEQNLGYLGVVMFFLVSGFVVSHVAVAERAWEFALKRVLRIYPALVLTVGVSALVLALGFRPPLVEHDLTVSAWTVLTNSLLVNYVITPQTVLVGAAWTLVIEMIFYVLLLGVRPLLRRATWQAVTVELVAVAVVVLAARDGGEGFFLFAVSASFVPALLLGQVVWAVSSGRIPLWAGGLLGSAAWLLYVWSGHRDMGRLDDAYDHTLMLGLLVFLVGLLAEPPLRRTRLVGFLADRSYSLYLMQGVVAFPVIVLLDGAMPYLAAVAVGLALTAAAVELSYRVAERPPQQLARALTRRWSTR